MLSANQFPTASSTAIIMYTSGSTGIPKGVILKHSNLLATLRGFTDSAHSFELNQSDVLIGFLPLAHVFELIVECVCLCSGIAIGYSSPFTLIDSSTKIKEGSRGDAPVLHPTIMTAVPVIIYFIPVTYKHSNTMNLFLIVNLRQNLKRYCRQSI